MKSQEIWRDIPDYEGDYQVSNLGRIKSLERIIPHKHSFHKLKEKILKNKNHPQGYLYIGLSKNKIRRGYKVHRLVGLVFIPNPLNKPEINHKNGIKFDNWRGNLEWVTSSENHIHAYRNGLTKAPMLGKYGKDHPVSKAVLQYDLNNSFIAEYGSSLEAMRKTKINRGSISCACNNKIKTAGGFKWKYKNPES